MHLMHSRKTYVFLVGILTNYAVAQGTNVTCLTKYDWMKNSRNQNPCLMTAYLNSACLPNPADAYIFSLNEGFHYLPSTAPYTLPCQCSTVLYSMISACSTCQNRESLPWSKWSSNCSLGVSRSSWPKPIPVDTSIPSWAYLDIVPVDNFDVQAAQIVAGQGAPESSATPSASGTAIIAPSKKSDARPIVGGVIGGLGGVALLAGIITFFILRHRRRSRTAPSAAFVPTPTNPEYSVYSLAPYDREKPYDPSVQYHAPLLADALPSPLSVNTSMPSTMTIYNPSDPSTFPSSVPPASLEMSSHQAGLYSPSLSARQHAARKYNGVPEV